MQYNGFFGCGSCLEPGASVINLKGNKVHTYPFKRGTAKGFRESRTHEDTVQTGHQVDASEPGTVKNGIKGSTYMAECPGFDLIRSVTTDYMHDTTLGLMCMIMRLLLDSTFKDYPWYIGNKKSILNQRLKSINPPCIINRMPVSFDNYEKNKASENKVILLFAFLPVVNGILREEYCTHFEKLVEAMHILLCSSISQAALQRARKLIVQFCRQFPDMYDRSFETAKLHNLLHLCDKVEDLGPAWCHNAYFYEDLNKDIRDMFSGTRNVHSQILSSVAINHHLPILAKKLTPGTPAADLYNDATTHYKIQSSMVRIAPQVYSIGSYKPCVVEGSLKDRFQNLYGRNLEFEQFERVMLGGTIVHSKVYREGTMRRNSYTVCYKTFGGQLICGQVNCFLKVKSRSSHYVALIRELLDNGEGAIANALHAVQPANHLSIVPVNNLVDLCFFISVAPNDCYVARFPNFIERE